MERLTEVFTTGDSSGEALCNKLLSTFAVLNLDLQWIVGQSYDGAGNVRGKYSGLKTKLLEVAKKALYIWCQAHRLNLVIEAVLASATQISGTLGLLQELYNFFNGYKRHAVFVAKQKDERYVRSLKKVSDTTRSWRSAEDGVNTVLECYECISDALEELQSTKK